MFPSTSVVIPCYKSSNSLPSLVERLINTLSKKVKELQIILVNDFSPDDTWQTITALSKKYEIVTGLNLSRNRGQQIATIAGLSKAKHDIVVTIDDDLEQSPEDIPNMISFLIKKDLDLVIAKLNNKAKTHGKFRALGSWMTRLLSRQILGISKDLKFSSFRVMHGWVARAAAKLYMPNPVVGYVLIGITHRVDNFEVNHHPRREGYNSGHGYLSLINLFLTMLFIHSTLPLKVISILSFIGFLTSVVLGTFYFTLGLFGYFGISGFTSIMVLLSFIGSLLLGAVSVLGQYIIQLLEMSGRSPLYYVRTKLSIDCQFTTDDNK